MNELNKELIELNKKISYFINIYKVRFTKESLKRCLNKNTSKQFKEKYKNNKQNYLNYYSRITSSVFVKDYLLKKYDYKCQLCGEDLDLNSVVVHHLNYDRVCINKDTTYNKIELQRKRRKVPDCENCKIDNPEEFYNCINNLRPVHKKCNAFISLIRRKGIVKNQIEKNKKRL